MKKLKNVIEGLLDFPIFRGRVIRAVYRIQEVVKYRNNPFIEALPPIWTVDEFMQAVSFTPGYDEAERQLPAHLRLHLIMSAAEFFQPLSRHIELEQCISRVIRMGYRPRNPKHKRFWQKIAENLEKLDVYLKETEDKRSEEEKKADDESFKEYVHSTRSSALSFALIGISGIGKTISLKSILSMYPQVICHTAYEGEKFTFRQLTWLIVECPHNGSVKQLCLNFLRAVDSILGTNYYSDYGNNGAINEAALTVAMARVAANHGLGLLVIDEIQNLSRLKSGGGEKMLNFFVGLTNIMGIPVVPVGTYRASALVANALRAVRRASGQGDPVWEPLNNDDSWFFFLESLWRYQYTRISTPLTKELSDALYDETQGVIDFAVKVFMLAQIRAISTGHEEITASFIHSVARDSLVLAQPMLRALRSGDSEALNKFDDIQPIDIRSHVDAALEKLRQRQVEQYYAQQRKVPQNSNQHSPAQDNSGETAASEKAIKAAGGKGNFLERKGISQGKTSSSKPSSQQNRSRKTKSEPLPGDLRYIAKQGEERGISVYQALYEAGYIKSAMEFLPDL